MANLAIAFNKQQRAASRRILQSQLFCVQKVSAGAALSHKYGVRIAEQMLDTTIIPLILPQFEEAS